MAQLLADIETGAKDLPRTRLADPIPGRLGVGLTATLVDVLRGATTTPNDVFVAVWEGWGDIPPIRFPGAAREDPKA